MADLSALGGLKPVEQLDLANYADNKVSTFQLPKAGRYTLRAPDSFPPASFTRTKAGALSVQVDPTIVGPTNEGFQIRFIKVSAKPYKRDGVTVSQLGDYLRATGFRGILNDEQAQADAAEATANTVYEAELDWRAYNKNTGYSLEGMSRFPKAADGSPQSWVEDPADYELDEAGQIKKDASGQKVHKRVRANIIVKNFIPQN